MAAPGKLLPVKEQCDFEKKSAIGRRVKPKYANFVQPAMICAPKARVCSNLRRGSVCGVCAYLCLVGFAGAAGVFRGSSESGKQRYVIVLLLLVNVTLFPVNLASLNCRQVSSFSLTLASHFS